MNTPLPSWDELAPRIAQQGYSVLPIERSEIEHYGREQPAQGGWAFGLVPPDKEKVGAEYYAAWCATHTVGILAGRLPIEGGTSRTECEATRICTVKITATTRERAASLEAIVREHVGGIGPVRMDWNDAGLLIPFRINEDARAFAGQSGLHIDAENHVSIGSAGTCFLADGWNFHWRDGISLAEVPRSDLPEMQLDMVRPLIDATNDYLQSQRPLAPPTELQLRLQARVAHRLACGVCASCQDSQPNDWVALHDLSWPACRIVSVDAATGEFHIEHEGKEYRAPGHRLFPTAAPVVPEPQRKGTELIMGGGFYRTTLETAS